MNNLWKYLTTLVCILIFGSGVAQAARGVSVSPSELMGDSIQSWPHTEVLQVTNGGDVTEWIEVRIPGNEEGLVSISPSRFPLEAGEAARIVVTFNEPEMKSLGKIEVVASRNNTDGLETGTGVEVLYAISKKSLTQGDMRAAVLAGTDTPIGGLMRTFMWVLFLSALLTMLVVLSRKFSRRF